MICFYLNQRSLAAETVPKTSQFSTTVPFTPAAAGGTVTGQALIKIQLGHGLSGTFFVDTASATSFISASLAHKLGLIPKPAVSNGRPFIIDGKQPTAISAPVFKIGGLSIPGQPLIVASDQFLAVPSAAALDGIIGINILRSIALQWGFKNHSLTLYYPGRLSASSLQQIGFVSPSTLAITEDAGDHSFWYASVRMINGFVIAEQPLYIDTGANSTVVPYSLAQHLGLKPYAQNSLLTFYGSETQKVANVEAIQLGGLMLSETPVLIHAASAKSQTGFLGLDLLSNYRVLMDFPAKKMYLQPNTAAVPTITIGPTPAPTTPPAK